MNPILHLDVTADGRTRSFTFDAFPVRIGRDDSNDCPLAFPFVSRLHATLHLRDGALVLRDEGSRNGLYAGGTKLDPHESVDLRAIGHHFEIMTVQLRATLHDDPMATTLLDGLPGEANATRHYEDAHIQPQIVDAHAVVVQVRAAYERYREAWEEIQRALATSVETLPSERRRAVLEHLALEFPQLARDPELRAFAGRYGVELPDDGASAGPTKTEVARDEMEEVLAEALSQHAELVANVGAGVRKLLLELSPDAIEAATPRGLWGIGRWRRLWNAFRYRYWRLAQADAPMLRACAQAESAVDEMLQSRASEKSAA